MQPRENCTFDAAPRSACSSLKSAGGRTLHRRCSSSSRAVNLGSKHRFERHASRLWARLSDAAVWAALSPRPGVSATRMESSPGRWPWVSLGDGVQATSG
jgi:hypothetical protein